MKGEESDSSFVDSCSVSNSSDTEDSSVWKVSKKVSEMLSGSKNSFPVSHSKHCTRISAPVILEQEAICGSKETSSGCWTQGPPKSPQAAAAASSREQEVPVALVVMKKQGTDGDAGDRPYKCEQCGWAFKKASNLRSHEETHRGLKSHVCELCGKAYSHQGTLQQHRRLHTALVCVKDAVAKEGPFTRSPAASRRLQSGSRKMRIIARWPYIG
ncbi:hypothetical protein Z043_100956 [Scleropages formosus]|uniref:C2H2-type domain-containing protein n=1 Tax=Scleropages formosus TaxID=113540 RepID=A0A0P7VAT5_SCLFO|nr:hypothetical protein Z043_100956 [Scleropages formosus]